MTFPKTSHPGRRVVAGLSPFAILLLLSAPAPAKEPSREAAEFFEKKVRPVLTEHCYSCHSAAKAKKKGGLVLDSRDALLAGGDSGPAVVPGQPGKSLLLRAVRHADDDLKMPPKGKLADEQIADLARWIQQGASWPGAATGHAARAPGKITDEDRQWWSFQPVRKPPVPAVRDGGWSANDIDRFILQRLQAEGLKPSPPADPTALVRRVYFDLVGLPPTPAEVDAFVAEPSPQAYERLVERLLASPRYGERWARHWLDLARYAESDGYRLDAYRPDAWRYRDYVVRSFNDDKPYDRFVREQLAGDELWPDDPDARAATGFLRLWIYEYNQRDVRTQWNIILDDLTDVAGDVFLGLSVACARCHDHKFDPILQKDYYRLRAFFAPILPRDDLPLATPEQLADYRKKLAAWEAKAADILKEMEAVEAPAKHRAARGAVEKFPEDIQAMILKPVAERTPLEHQLAELAYRQVYYEWERIEAKLKDADKQKLIELKRKLAAHDALRPVPPPLTPTVTDVGPVAPPTYIPKKTAAGEVEPGYLTILDEKPAVISPPAVPNSTGRRAELARWLTRPDHPLTARVVVNRVWQYHFGRGLVATASDFGKLGEKPSHPELLDWLATRFVEGGWSFKQLHRLILTSATYRQSATVPASEEAVRKDPENRLLWKMGTRRLEAEQVRDAILAVTGELDPHAAGAPVGPEKPVRTIYTRVQRNTRDPLLDVFDAPEGFTSSAERHVTTTPTQSLLLLNSPFMLERSRALAARLRREASGSDGDQVEAAFRLLYGRRPTRAERETALHFLREQAGRGGGRTVVAGGFQAEKVPYREGRGALLQPGGQQVRFEVPESPMLPGDEFTVEAFVVLRSLYEDASVRPIAAHWSGDRKKPGWSFGVTSKRSAFKPQNLVLQLFGDAAKNGTDYEAIFSGLHITLNKPYYVAVSVKLSDPGKKGVTFYAKDLSNDEEPLQVSPCGHKMTSLSRASGVPFLIGGHGLKPVHTWDGVVDDVRLSSVALRAEQLLLTTEGVTDRTVGYWQFENRLGVYHDSSPHGLHIRTQAAAGKNAAPDAAALVDLCHVLLNSNEFLYVD